MLFEEDRVYGEDPDCVGYRVTKRISFLGLLIYIVAIALVIVIFST